MNTKIFKGTVFGGVVYFLLGWLVYGIFLTDFSLTNYNQCANRPEAEMIWWAMIGSSLAYTLFLTLMLKWSGASGLIDGLKTGALFGFLFSVTINLSFYSMTTMFNSIGGMLVDIVVTTLMATATGAAIVLLWGKNETS